MRALTPLTLLTAIAVACAPGRHPVAMAASPVRDSVAHAEPVAGSCEAPHYPRELSEAGISGYAIVDFVIDTTGMAVPSTVVAVQVTHPGFARPAEQAVLTCRYRPERVNGTRVPIRVRQRVSFDIMR